MINLNNPIPHTIGEFTKVLDSFYVYTGDIDDSFVQRQCQLYGKWDSELTSWMIRNISPGWTCLDIGANIGYFTELMAILSGPDGQVLSFEPIEYLVDKALESESINDHSNCASIKRFPVALSDKDGESSIYIWDSNVGASMVIDGEIPDNYMQWGSHSKKIIKTKRLDSIFNEKIDFIKIDVENHEELVFKGFGKNAQECPVIIAELGNQQPVKFLEELSHIYNMSRLDGVPADVNEIMKHGIINILLEKK